MRLSDLLKDIDFKIIHGSSDLEINSICYDSRKSVPDSLFVAIKGTKTDGHKYINDLIGKGITAIVCEDSSGISINNSSPAIIQVDNSRKALAQISKNWYKNPLMDIKVIGVTGTNGKTTITYLLKAIFDSAGFKTGIIGTTGIFIGNNIEPATHTTPESLELFGHFDKMRKEGIEFIFIEVSSHSLHQNRVFSIDFDSVIFTNLTHEHLDYHKTMDEYASVKKMLFNMLNSNGIAIVNGDDEYSELMLENINTSKKIKIGRGTTNDYIIGDETLNLNEMQFSLSSGDSQITFKTPMIGRFNIDNSALAIVCALQYGIEFNLIKNAIQKSFGAPGRMQRILLKNGAIGIVDYSHTPDALEKALTTCKEILNITGLKSKVICVFGCGGDRDKTKRPLMGKISSSLADFTIITDDNPRTEISGNIISDIYEGIEISKKETVKIIPDRREAIAYAVGLSEKNDIILVAGKGHENYQIYGTNKTHFDDAVELSKFS